MNQDDESTNITGMMNQNDKNHRSMFQMDLLDRELNPAVFCVLYAQ